MPYPMYSVRKMEQPTNVKQFLIPAAHLTFISSSPNNSPMLVVKQPHSNELSFVIKFSKLNSMYDDYISYKNVHQCLHRLGGLGANFMSALDLINANWQLTLQESCQHYNTFTVPGKGKFICTVTIMGLKTSPSAFSRLMEIQKQSDSSR